tara:strand:- start:2232 stop:2444 length:213 start_codon:yes stop_codon:yes gene_type:complete
VNYLLTAALFASCFIVTACDSNLSRLDGSDLRERAYRCANEMNMTTAEIQVCKNIQRECQRRQDAGRFEC